jgi:hypothetical protein
MLGGAEEDGPTDQYQERAGVAGSSPCSGGEPARTAEFSPLYPQPSMLLIHKVIHSASGSRGADFQQLRLLREALASARTEQPAKGAHVAGRTRQGWRYLSSRTKPKTAGDSISQRGNQHSDVSCTTTGPFHVKRSTPGVVRDATATAPRDRCRTWDSHHIHR